MKAPDVQLSSGVPLGITVTNTFEEGISDQVYDLLQEELSDAETLTHAPSGGLSGAAVDVWVVLGAIGSIASVASILWTAYDKFVAKPGDSNANRGIYVAFTDQRGFTRTIWIGVEENSKDAVEKKLRDICLEIDKDDSLRLRLNQIGEELKREPTMRRRKKRRR